MSTEQQKGVTSPETAISVLVQAAKIGQAKGAYSLEDASMIADAIKFLIPAQPEPEASTEEVTEEKAS